jgi:hypothetical protein
MIMPLPVDEHMMQGLTSPETRFKRNAKTRKEYWTKVQLSGAWSFVKVDS